MLGRWPGASNPPPARDPSASAFSRPLTSCSRAVVSAPWGRRADRSAPVSPRRRSTATFPQRTTLSSPFSSAASSAGRTAGSRRRPDGVPPARRSSYSPSSTRSTSGSAARTSRHVPSSTCCSSWASAPCRQRQRAASREHPLDRPRPRRGSRPSRPGSFAHSWHILMKGSIIAAAEGDVDAAQRARSMARLLIAEYR